jgi:selenocysteine lyase/cysteine desulfurase
MDTNHRRNFIKSISAGIAGTLILPNISSANNRHLSEKTFQTNDNSEDFWELVKSQYRIAEGVNYFNNASLGPSPLPVQKATNHYRELLDGFPSKYMWGGWKEDIETVRQKAADFLNVSEEEIALIHNTTEGMNMIARSFDLKPGDEVILADHEHPSGTIPWEVWQETKGIKLVRPELPIEPKSYKELLEVYKKAITPKTKIISMCHIVNTNGMILPVKEVSEMAHKKGILVAVDGAQAAGMFKIDLNDLGCDYYAASSHKWLFSPKGVGIFYAKKESQHHLKPLIVAKGYTDKSIRRLENYNTRNLPEVLGLGAAIDFHNKIGIEKTSKRTFELKEYFRSKIEEISGVKLKTPASDKLSGAIQVVEIVGKDVTEMKDKLFETAGIDTRPMSNFGLNALRVSLAIYNTKKDIDLLVENISKLANA